MDIVEELRHDREAGARRLETEYKAGLMALARRFCNDPGDAEELVNSTFAEVVENVDDFLEQSSLFTWMCKILTSKFSRSIRRKSSQMEVYPGVVPDVEDEHAREAIYENLDASLLRDAIDTLPPDIRKTLMMHYFMDFSVKDVARMLAVPSGTVMWRLHYARKILAAKLGAKVRETAKKPGVKALLVALALCGLTAIGAGLAAAVRGTADTRQPTADTAGQTDPSGPSDLAGQPGQPDPSDPSGLTGGTDSSGWTGLAGWTADSFSGEQNMNTNKTTRAAVLLTAGTLALTPTTQATDLCYRLPDATPYTWNGGTWIIHTNKVAHGAVPTASDNVFIWGTGLKADENDTGKPLCVASGEVALTKDFTIGWNGVANSSSNNKILFEIQDGGVMTNAGPVKLGVVENGYTKQTNPGGLATVRAGGSWVARNGVTVGASSTGNRNRIVIERGGEMDAVTGEFIVANVAGRNACVTNAGTLAAYDFFAGGYGNGDFENSGDFSVGRKFTIGRQAGSHGHVRHSGGTFSKGTPSAQPVHVGYNGTGVFEVFAPLALQKNERLVLGGTATGEGTLVLGTGGSINNVTNISIGAFVAGARGHLQMTGGTLTVQALASGSPYALLVGRIGSSGAQQAWGDISGYGTIARDDNTRSTRIKLYGRVVASGGDLDLASVKTVGEAAVDANVCGSNGWYAVNGGRLIYPATQDFSYAEHATIGDYVYRGGVGSRADDMDITLVNALQLRLFDANGDQLVDGKYNHAALYAADHGDIPGAVPGSASPGDVTLGVWRLGHFDKPGDDDSATAVGLFDKAWLRFRIDSNAIPEDVDWTQFKVRLYRWDGSAWKVAGTASGTDMPYVETATAQPAGSGVGADGWNIGWYAAALVRNGCFTIVVR